MSFVFPPVRQAVTGIFLLLVAVAIGTVLVVGIHKLVSRRFRPASLGTTGQEFTLETLAPAAEAPSAPKQFNYWPVNASPQTTGQLIQQLRTIDWFQFEQLVAMVYRKQGYAVDRRGGANPDGGIDLVIEKDGMRTAVQCKHWKTWDVGVKAVREFLGALVW